MKLVKLNRRHTAYKELGHKWAFRWNSYDSKTCPKVESVMFAMHGSQYSYKATTAWKSGFGHATRGSVYRPYWVSFADEQDATMILLQLDTN